MSEYLNNLAAAVSNMHGCPCSHSDDAIVREMIDGKIVWNGKVEIFDLVNHPKATKAFAWAFKDEKGEIQYMAVLNVPPIENPRDAIQAAIASGRFQ